MTDDTPCAGCHRPNRGTGYACPVCRTRAAQQLAELPDLHRMLPIAVVPGGTGHGDGTQHRKPDAAPLPLRLDAFNLISAGSVDPDIREHQIGVLPVATWVTAWYYDWADRYKQPATAPIAGANPGRAGSAQLMRHLLTQSKILIARDPGGQPIQAAISDTLDAEYAARFGRPGTGGVDELLAALASWLDEACDTDPQIGDFLAGLRALYGACKAVLGERSDLIRLGRCPQTLTDRDTGGEERCGAVLWQDPYVSKIVCPRCRHEWKEDEWLWLGRRINDLDGTTTAADHRFASELVIVKEQRGEYGLTAETDRYWLVRCTCALMAEEQVRGKRRDAYGRWQRHRDEITAATGFDQAA